MKKIGVIHTTAATISGIGALISELIGGAEIVNILDDSILGDMREQRGVQFVRERWLTYARILEQMHVDAVLSACSTVGGFAEEAGRLLQVPVYRIDEAMCEQAVQTGENISVFATLQSTLNPTVDLIRRKAEQSGRQIRVNTVLVDGAYQELMNGNREVHDRKIREAVEACLDTSDVIVLAQASMAAAIGDGTPGQEKILTSPRLGICRLRDELCQENRQYRENGPCTGHGPESKDGE